MKIVFKAFSIMLLFILFGVTEAYAGTASANINITGRIMASPCTVDTNTVNNTINLGKTFVANLVSGTGSKWVPFLLTLSKCPVGTINSTVTFTGTEATDDNYFENGGDAKGVVLQISDSGHIKSYGNGDKLTEPVDESRNVTFLLEARMFNPGGKVTGGNFYTAVQVDFTYQ